ncbi:glutathione S-transferase [Kiloniella litopenaei]|uniref:Glutathione S-transferase n=1 Tax=Kiloniella litopenaei TaxID=1549748 RepID=A0A0M2RDV2_9PROT|nr:glutathione S-transferase family protein [Kiloniella litopenaei]KKJ78165.1 glutathione S-transferase [Kiloniella litopenaei]
MLTLFHAPGACSLASCIALEETDAEFEIKTVSFADGEQHKADYLRLNPKGRVPALVVNDGTVAAHSKDATSSQGTKGVLTETPAILFYLAQQFPQANLAPLGDNFALAQMQSFNSFLCSTVHVAHAHKLRGARWANKESSYEDMRAKVPENMSTLFTMIEETYLGQPWVLGEQYSICDAYLYTIARWLEGDGVDITAFPRVNAHFKRMEDRPAVQRALRH